MAKVKRKLKKYRVSSIKEFNEEPHMMQRNIASYNTEQMQVYGINVVLGRHVPMIIDGLKPVERRILYTLYRLRKAAKVSVLSASSETLKIHPHGDMSVYNTLVRLGQPWANMICNIDSVGGNYGCVDGFSSQEAAPRYLYATLSKFAKDCFFSDFDPKIVEMLPNYDDTMEEPLYLPAKYPHAFINGASGMAFGYTTNIPTYNIKEILMFTIKLMEDPDKKHGVIVPDTPTGCDIVDSPGVFERLTYVGYTGGDKDGPEDRSVPYTVRSVIDVDEDAHEIIIQNLPPAVTAEKLLNGIKEMRDNGILDGCTKIFKNSQGEDFEIVLRFRDEVDLFEMRERLFSRKLLTVNTISAQLICIDDMQIKKYSLKDAILQWIAYRRDFKRRFYNMKIVQMKERIHALEILLFLFSADNAERTLKILKKSEDRADIIRRLVKEYDIDSLKAATVADMKNHEYSKKSRKGFATEMEELTEKVDKYMKIATSMKKIDAIIIDELKEGIKKYSEPRRSNIIRLEDLNSVPDTDHTIVITENGYIKKLKEGVTSVGTVGQKDNPMEILSVNNRDALIIFDSKGRVHTVPVNNIRGCSLDSHGSPMSTYAKLENAKIVAVFLKDDNGILKHQRYDGSDTGYFLFVTKRGIVKKTPYVSYMKLKVSTTGTVLRAGDELVSVKFIAKDTDVVVFTWNGIGLRFDSDTFTETKRMSIGVKSFNVAENDFVRDTVILSKKDTHLFLLTDKGFGKKISLDNIDTEDRRKDATVLATLRPGDHLLFGRGVTNNDQYTVFLKEFVQEIEISDVPEQYRLGTGAKLVPVKRGETIIKMIKSR